MVQVKTLRKIRIMKEDLPSPYAIKCINQEFLKNYVKEKKDEHGEPTFYELHGKTPKEMKKHINDLPEEDFEKILRNFPATSDIFYQCAYYYRAFSKSQVFLDANHRTGLFSLKQILRQMGIIINASLDDIVCITNYMKAEGWITQGQMIQNLKEKDEEHRYLLAWFQRVLQLR